MLCKINTLQAALEKFLLKSAVKKVRYGLRQFGVPAKIYLSRGSNPGSDLYGLTTRPDFDGEYQKVKNGRPHRPKKIMTWSATFGHRTLQVNPKLACTASRDTCI